MRTRWVRWLAVAAAGAVVAGCGTGGETVRTGGDVAAPPAREAAAAYGVLTGLLNGAKVPTCEPAEGGGFIPLPAPAAEAAQAHSWFRYLEGRIYEFGPCQLAAGRRNELRIYRYADTEARDTALRETAARMTRPTATFAYGERVAIEIWSPEPSLDSPAGQVAQAVHSAIGALPQAWHLDVVGS